MGRHQNVGFGVPRLRKRPLFARPRTKPLRDEPARFQSRQLSKGLTHDESPSRREPDRSFRATGGSGAQSDATGPSPLADDGIAGTAPVAASCPDFAVLLAASEGNGMWPRPRAANHIGRPIGDLAFIDQLERDSGRRFKPPRPGFN